ncbi:hypothetical protein NDU88_001745 [Pleurodeles waltl]|uniref:Uncharacterized protein n=1 Tax=Pleurodeles waltl TaxID=8319 RepID=A0AAV7SAY8_PLEWA|nr:hypothetical protein NDU88_001745 [Pleurodeles waltl]
MFVCRQQGEEPGTTRRILQQALYSGPHLLQSPRAQKALIISRAPHAPAGGPGTRKPGGNPSRGSGEAHEAGAPSRSTHREPISKRRGGWGEPRPETAAGQAPLGVFRAPVLFPLDRGRPQRPSPPRTPKESARAGDSQHQAP